MPRPHLTSFHLGLTDQDDIYGVYPNHAPGKLFAILLKKDASAELALPDKVAQQVSLDWVSQAPGRAAHGSCVAGTAPDFHYKNEMGQIKSLVNGTFQDINTKT